jgi:hypothetical protein
MHVEAACRNLKEVPFAGAGIQIQLNGIVAGIAGKNVVAVSCGVDELIVADAAGELVITGCAPKGVVAALAIESVGFHAAGERVVPNRADRISKFVMMSVAPLRLLFRPGGRLPPARQSARRFHSRVELIQWRGGIRAMAAGVKIRTEFSAAELRRMHAGSSSSSPTSPQTPGAARIRLSRRVARIDVFSAMAARMSALSTPLHQSRRPHGNRWRASRCLRGWS